MLSTLIKVRFQDQRRGHRAHLLACAKALCLSCSPECRQCIRYKAFELITINMLAL